MNSIKLPEDCAKQWEVLLLLLSSEEKKIDRTNDTEVDIMSYFMRHDGVKKIILQWLKQMNDVYANKVNEKDTASKSDSISLLWRQEGNDHFRNNNIEESYKCYTSSLIYAESEGQMFALAAANRSAALLKMKKFKDCLSDIDLALKYNYPEEQRHKLLLRQADCHAELHNPDASRESLDKARKHASNLQLSPTSEFERLFSLVSARLARAGAAPAAAEPAPAPRGDNADFVHACSALALRRSDRAGRHVVTRAPTEFGQVLFSEEPYACVALPLDGDLPAVCEHCCRRDFNPVPCTWCARAVYCGEACRDAARAAHHRWECAGARARLFPTIGIAHLALRVLLVSASAGLPPPPGPPPPAPLSAAELMQRYGSLDGVRVYAADVPPFYRMFHLVTNFDKMNNDDLVQYALTATMLTLYLERYTTFLADFETAPVRGEDRALLAAALVLRALGQLVCNGHAALSLTVVDEGKGDRRTQCEREQRHATAIYPSAAMMNHSCDPNIINTFYRSRLIIRGASALAAGAEVLNCYGPHRAREPAPARRARLAAQYRFSCECSACLDPRRDSVLLFSAYACASCKGPARVVCAQCRAHVNPERCAAALRAADEQEMKAELASGAEARTELMTSSFRLRQQVWHRHHAELRRAADRLARYFADIGEYSKSIELIKQNIQTLEYQFGSFSAEVGNELRKLVDVMMERIFQSPTHPDYRDWCLEAHKILKKTYLLLELNYGAWEPLVQRARDQLDAVCALLDEPAGLALHQLKI